MMDGAENVHGGYLMGHRIPLVRRNARGEAVIDVDLETPTRRLSPRETTDCSGANANLCEKPASGQNYTLPIALGVSIPLACMLVAFIWLHRRNVKRVRMEDAAGDPHKSLDFGMVMNGGNKGKGNRKSAMFGGGGPEKPPNHRQLSSMDLDMSSPYLLPPGLQNSRESLHSLSRSLHQDDPYRPIQGYAGSDAASMRSFKKNDEASIYTSSSSRKDTGFSSRLPPTPTVSVPPRRKVSLPTSPTSPQEPAPPRYEPSHAEIVTPPAPVKDSFSSQVQPDHHDAGDGVPYPDGKTHVSSLLMPAVPEIQEPPVAASKSSIAARPPSPRSSASPTPIPESTTQNSLQFNFFNDDESVATVAPSVTPHHSVAESTSSRTSEPQSQRQSQDSALGSLPKILESRDYHEYHLPTMSPVVEVFDETEQRGRPQHRRQSSEYPEDLQPASLGVPQQNQKRLSVGFRPLPPDEVMDTEDPETRANRIRSFYKEYFDESKPHDQNQAQGFPGYSRQQGGYNNQQGGYYNVQGDYDDQGGYGYGGQGGYDNGYYQGQYNNQGGGYNQHSGYYEDYDQNYLGDAAYFDPDSNAFVMPYAEPVARRAMTPPPSGSRFPGPRGGPRGHHGSIGGMSMPGGSRGPPRRPGSSASSNNRWGPGPRPGSSASQQYNRPRAGSAYSARSGPRKPMPPPSALSTLPNPSKLRDDSFAIFNANEFAPPTTFKDQAAGRSQSPAGERRPYLAPSVGHSPLVSAFEEMAALPSPHLLRKSGTFTGLDFAPPRKFKEADTMSDAGSIRSNRSGISAVQLGAIRSGAGRVSRLPGDTVFSQAQMAETLKPSWGMRP